MRTFADEAFANVFALALDATNAGRRLNRWQVAGVERHRERLSHSGPIYTFRCEVHTVTRSSAPAWRLLYVMETWWDEAEKTAVRDARWGRLLQGRRSEVFAWFRERADR